MKKAQTSIEILMLLGGAILVTIIIGIALKNVGSQSANTTTNTIKCTMLDCTSCKTTAGCTGYQADGTVLAWDITVPATDPCTSIDKALFSSCKPT